MGSAIYVEPVKAAVTAPEALAEGTYTFQADGSGLTLVAAGSEISASAQMVIVGSDGKPTSLTLPSAESIEGSVNVAKLFPGRGWEELNYSVVRPIPTIGDVQVTTWTVSPKLIPAA